MRDNQYYVYIATNKSRTLYVGVTNNLERRMYEHRQKANPGFTSRYNINKLVYFEVTSDVHSAISREKQIKGWLRSKKIVLIESVNPDWKDLSAGLFGWRDFASGFRQGKTLRDPSTASQDDSKRTEEREE